MSRRTTLSSGIVTVSQSPYTVVGHRAVLVSAHLYTDGTNDATLTIYDSSSGANGNVLAKYVAKGSELQLGEGGIWVLARNGITISLSGGSCSALIRWTPCSGGDYAL